MEAWWWESCISNGGCYILLIILLQCISLKTSFHPVHHYYYFARAITINNWRAPDASRLFLTVQASCIDNRVVDVSPAPGRPCIPVFWRAFVLGFFSGRGSLWFFLIFPKCQCCGWILAIFCFGFALLLVFLMNPWCCAYFNLCRILSVVFGGRKTSHSYVSRVPSASSNDFSQPWSCVWFSFQKHSNKVSFFPAYSLFCFPPNCIVFALCFFVLPFFIC